MKKAMFGAMLSGFVFPGVGQMALKHQKRGIFFIVLSLLSLIGFVSVCTRKALSILEQVQAENRMMDLQAVSKAVETAMTASDNSTITISLILILSVWLISTVDAYRLGRRMDGENHP